VEQTSTVDGDQPVRVRAVAAADRRWVEDFLAAHGSTRVVSRGALHHPADLPGLVAEAGAAGDPPIGLLTWRAGGGAVEVVTLHAGVRGRGAGTALLAAARAEAERIGCRRLWLVTTNDNTSAFRWYQRRGMVLAAAHVGALAGSRRLKPEIPETGDDGIPIRDELELELCW
jgi:ribosomal protein S18 acetylase RimI-like enzyme